MALRIDALRAFRAVAERGNLSEAAADLGRTPSAVSMTLAGLEEALGGALFEGARKARLTPLGRAVLAEASAALDHLDGRLRAIDQAARGDSGLVRVAATPSVAAMILPDVVARFRAARPEVAIELRDMDSAAILSALEAERADLGLATAPDCPDGLEARALFSDAFGLVVPQDHRLAGARAPGWDALAGEAFIRNGLCDRIDAPAFAPLRDGASLSVPSTASLLALVRAGVGVTVLPRLAVPEGSGVAFVPLAGVAARREVHLVSRPRRMLAPATRALADAVMAAAPLQRG